MKILFPLITLGFCYLLLAAVILLTWGTLPPIVASHFDGQGHANGWMSRDATVEFTVALGLFMPGLLAGLIALAGWMPSNLVNVPRREYWLSEGHRGEMSALLLRFALWFACLNVLFVTGLHGLIVLANGGSGHLNGNGIALVSGGFLIGTVVWLCGLLFRLARPPVAERK
jgi:hypothetical protein